MKRLLSLGMLLAMILVLTACQSSKIDAAASSNYLEDLKTGKFEQAQTKLESVPESFQYGDNEVMKSFFAKMIYTVKETKNKGDEAVATVAISLPNTAMMYDEMMTNIGEDVQKLQKGDDAAKTKASGMMVEYLLNKINDENVARAENTVEITLKLVDGKTVIVPNDDLSKALSGIPIEKK